MTKNKVIENKNVGIKVEYLTRVEGHGDIVINIKNNKIEKVEFNVVESPRFFEGMLRGRSIFEAQHITSRVCGICACAHTLASIQASEDILGIKPSEQTKKLRRLLMDFEIMDSHILHVYLLAAPDALNAKSFMSLLKTHNQVVRRAFRMKKACNDLCDVLVGRHVHPVRAIIGGWTKLPKDKDLENMSGILKSMRQDINASVEFFETLKFPDFQRETEYLAMSNDSTEYPLLDGKVTTSRGRRFDKKEYRDYIKEFVNPNSTAKFTELAGIPPVPGQRRASSSVSYTGLKPFTTYMVGALARFNINYNKLLPVAKDAAGTLKLKPVCFNPYMNTIAQVVEIVQCFEDAVSIVEDLKKNGINYKEEIIIGLNETNRIPVKAGRGVGAIEVPRGTLFHDYEIDKNGIILNANFIIPTNQNVHNIQQDMRKLLPEIMHKSKEEITLLMEMLVRAYDPCMSCSVH